mmetsp:Transcript_454/g.1775  ORF Transcript_454/g.1775 Transcript_454/m.1775 type:complete len:219 (+) Transcript_454:1618-2274(+)
MACCCPEETHSPRPPSRSPEGRTTRPWDRVFSPRVSSSQSPQLLHHQPSRRVSGCVHPPRERVWRCLFVPPTSPRYSASQAGPSRPRSHSASPRPSCRTRTSAFPPSLPSDHPPRRPVSRLPKWSPVSPGSRCHSPRARHCQQSRNTPRPEPTRLCPPRASTCPFLATTHDRPRVPHRFLLGRARSPPAKARPPPLERARAKSPSRTPCLAATATAER